jgi:hypothetical protein
VRALAKEAGERCRHQKFKVGCTVYRGAGFPVECGAWSCRWLVDDDAADLARPDRSHVVVDMMMDYVEARDDETGEVRRVPVVQVWVDPKYPDAHRDPGLRAYLNRRGAEGIATLIRYSSTVGFTLWPPSMSGGGWVQLSGQSSGRDHTADEIVNFLVGAER